MSAKWTFWAWEIEVKTSVQKLALLQLANNANDDGKSWYPINKMASACNMSERTFQRAIKDLEESSLLHVERRSNRPSVYKLGEIEVTLHWGVTESPRLSDVAGCQSVTSRGVTESLVPNNNPNNNPNNKIYSEEFEYFWANSGIDNGVKLKASKSFEKKAKESDSTAFEFAQFCVQDCKFRIKNQFGFENVHATTYLNNERWKEKKVINNAAANREASGSTREFTADDFDLNAQF